MKLGDTVKVVKGSYEGAIGTVVDIMRLPGGDTVVMVEPNENADCRPFLKEKLKVIKSVSKR